MVKFHPANDLRANSYWRRTGKMLKFVEIVGSPHLHAALFIDLHTRSGHGEGVTPFAGEGAGAGGEGRRQADTAGIVQAQGVDGDVGQSLRFGGQAQVGAVHVEFEPRIGGKTLGYGQEQFVEGVDSRRQRGRFPQERIGVSSFFYCGPEWLVVESLACHDFPD
jgi:hypothetical protein